MINMTWEHTEYIHPYIAPPELVDADNRKVPMSTAAANSGGVSLLIEYRSAVGSLSAAITRRQTVTKQPHGVVLQQGWRGGKLSKRPQAENSTGIRPTDGSMASPLGLGGILSPSNSLAYK